MTFEQLLEENEQLKRQNQLYRDVVAFTGHEWRNQLSLLRLSTTSLDQDAGSQFTEQQRTALKRIQHSAAAIHRTADNYLMWSRLDRGPFTLNSTFVDLQREIFGPVNFLFAEQLATYQQQVKVHLCQPGLLVWADKSLLVSLYENLLDNTLRASKPGSTVIVRGYERGHSHEFSIWTDGAGLPDGYLDEILARFTTGYGDSSSCGLGVYLAYRIAEAHGGELRIVSVPESWTNVVVTLPQRRT
ncbi:MAG: HAMP domain-containing histidine kinase [Chloroflexi bacterium]|nr:HAMP domain-containing histidine kinase [Chloroflexota bacterium]